ncbi:hypothetical protein GXP67_25295 [Rhodocytophaga rosea]|uniref:Uncharacterized protein n=1 Tax=Rhodocytophaga rosea TaxID=2704465 RepID=A0A6C0GPE7_9BACT|nr:hypothetical protein [Rhodocytophaga rosea]QHT69724.1 hypothetical protein GXP67_25295 [Rhodocytophaga rosea]
MLAINPGKCSHNAGFNDCNPFYRTFARVAVTSSPKYLNEQVYLKQLLRVVSFYKLLQAALDKHLFLIAICYTIDTDK